MNESAAHTSRGMLVASRWTKSLPVDTVEVSSEAIALRPKMRPERLLARSDILRIEYDRVRLPLWWSNDFYFRMTDGTRFPKLFQPLRSKRFIQMLIESGYEVLDLLQVSSVTTDAP
jgi:hypothetical protein